MSDPTQNPLDPPMSPEEIEAAVAADAFDSLTQQENTQAELQALQG